jgi:hypothetical protein
VNKQIIENKIIYFINEKEDLIRRNLWRDYFEIKSIDDKLNKNWHITLKISWLLRFLMIEGYILLAVFDNNSKITISLLVGISIKLIIKCF